MSSKKIPTRPKTAEAPEDNTEENTPRRSRRTAAHKATEKLSSRKKETVAESTPAASSNPGEKRSVSSEASAAPLRSLPDWPSRSKKKALKADPSTSVDAKHLITPSDPGTSRSLQKLKVLKSAEEQNLDEDTKDAVNEEEKSVDKAEGSEEGQNLQDTKDTVNEEEEKSVDKAEGSVEGQNLEDTKDSLNEEEKSVDKAEGSAEEQNLEDTGNEEEENSVDDAEGSAEGQNLEDTEDTVNEEEEKSVDKAERSAENQNHKAEDNVKEEEKSVDNEKGSAEEQNHGEDNVEAEGKLFESVRCCLNPRLAEIVENIITPINSPENEDSVSPPEPFKYSSKDNEDEETEQSNEAAALSSADEDIETKGESATTLRDNGPYCALCSQTIERAEASTQRDFPVVVTVDASTSTDGPIQHGTIYSSSDSESGSSSDSPKFDGHGGYPSRFEPASDADRSGNEGSAASEEDSSETKCSPESKKSAVSELAADGNEHLNHSPEQAKPDQNSEDLKSSQEDEDEINIPYLTLPNRSPIYIGYGMDNEPFVPSSTDEDIETRGESSGSERDASLSPVSRSLNEIADQKLVNEMHDRGFDINFELSLSEGSAVSDEETEYNSGNTDDGGDQV